MQTLQIPPSATHSIDHARAHLESLGWTEVGCGDWSWVFGDPSGALAARITAFDPAYQMFAEACLRGISNRWLPRLHQLTPLGRNGYLVVMERLWPADQAAAEALCASIGIGNHTGWTPPVGVRPLVAEGPDLAQLRQFLTDLIAEGAAKFQLWGGSDIRPGNIMADARGHLKVVDPVFVKGLDIVSAISQGQVDRLADFTRSQLQDFLTNPPFKPGDELEALREKLEGLASALGCGSMNP